MTVELCYPCSRIIEKGTQNGFVPDWDTIQPLLDRIAELELKIVMLDEACANCGVKTTDGYALYCVKCSEPLREWVGLTNEEIDNLNLSNKIKVKQLILIIESQLKEKNT